MGKIKTDTFVACLDLCSSFSLLKPLEIAEFKETVNHSYWQIKKLP